MYYFPAICILASPYPWDILCTVFNKDYKTNWTCEIYSFNIVHSYTVNHFDDAASVNGLPTQISRDGSSHSWVPGSYRREMVGRKKLQLELKALNLPSGDAMSKSDPFMVIFQVSMLVHLFLWRKTSDYQEWSVPLPGADWGDSQHPQPGVEHTGDRCWPSLPTRAAGEEKRVHSQVWNHFHVL